MKSASLLTLLLCLVPAWALAALKVPAVQMPAQPGPLEKLAALEVQRYTYLRTGQLPAIVSAPKTSRVVVARKDRSIIDNPSVRQAAAGLGPQQYIIRTTTSKGERTSWLIGGDDTGTLYAAYRFAEGLGVRFYLHGDVLPDARLTSLPDLNEKGKPLFSIRGIQPFHDFPEGPDWWNQDDYLAYISQLPKMRMNFIGLHCYPEGGVGPEPAVWIGLQKEVDSQGRVKSSYPSEWANTSRRGMWGYDTMKTSDFCAGASSVFADDVYAPDVMSGSTPRPTSPEAANDVFNRTGDLFRTAFASARSLGVKTCIGTETPLTIPREVRSRLAEQGLNPDSPEAAKELYKGMFSRIARAYPVDYYWLWTPEGWTWGGNSEEDEKATVRDIQAALGALDSLGNPFKLATCGWVLGPARDRAALDKILPKDSPMSCINRNVGHAPVEPGFASISGRPKWAIPWMENDPNLVAPQPWAGRMRADAVEALRLGCTGLLGIHWRTKALSANVSALADAAWDQSWAVTPAGSEVKPPVGAIGGATASFTAPVEGTGEDFVYQTVRYDTEGYNLRVPNGVYKVTLQFSEPFYESAGKRVFGAEIQGRKVIDRLDMFERVGKNVAIEMPIADTRVTDGTLRIKFIRIVEFPCIAGIVVEGKTADGKAYTRKIDCGGPGGNGYEADTETVSTVPGDARTMPVEDFYVDFARASFGPDVAVKAGKILAKIDGRGLPEPATWINGPGGMITNGAPCEDVKKRYAFVDELQALRPRVKGAGNVDRFDYWLNTYRAMKSMAELGCLRGQLDREVQALPASQDKPVAALAALRTRTAMSRLWERMMTYELQTFDTPGELGTMANLEQHSRSNLRFLTAHDRAIYDALGRTADEVALSGAYAGPDRLVVPTVRTQVRKGESLHLRIIWLGKGLPTQIALFHRPLGRGTYSKLTVQHVGRGVYEAVLPAAQASFEYYVSAGLGASRIVWPAAAPAVPQTVVVW